VTEGVVDILETVEVDEQQGTWPSAFDEIGEMTCERETVRSSGDAVQGVETLVLGRGAAQRARRACDKPEQDSPQPEQSREQQQVKMASLGIDAALDRRVAEIRLERADRHLAVARPQRDVHLEQSAVPAVVHVLGLREVARLRPDASAECALELLVDLERLADQ
jgi:hypothetical protein